MSDISLRQLLEAAQRGDNDAIEAILNIFQPIIYKNSRINGCLNYDFFQELNVKLIYCIKSFKFMNITDLTKYFN